MWKYIVGGFVSLVIAALIMFTLMNIRVQDVVAYNQIERPTGTAPFRAGDLVEISADGQIPIGRLDCRIEEQDGSVSDTPLEKEYKNALREFMPLFVNLVNWGKGLFVDVDETPSLDPQTPSLNFVGYKSFLNADTPSLGPGCACAIARVVLRRNKVCTVQSSLIESKMVHSVPLDPTSPLELVERTIGVSYRPEAAHIPDLSHLACEGLNTEAILPSKPPNCPSGPQWPIDVKLRGFLGVISEQDRELIGPINVGAEIN